MADHPEFSGQALDPENADSPFNNSTLHSGTTKYAKHHRALARGPKLARITLAGPVTVGGYADTDNVAIGGLQHEIPSGAVVLGVGIYAESRNGETVTVKAAVHTEDDPTDLKDAATAGLTLSATASWVADVKVDLAAAAPVEDAATTFSVLASSATSGDTAELRNLSAWCHYIDP